MRFLPICLNYQAAFRIVVIVHTTRNVLPVGLFLPDLSTGKFIHSEKFNFYFRFIDSGLESPFRFNELNASFASKRVLYCE